MRCAVLGDPVEHSLSPALHRAAYAALGLDWTYDAVRVPSGGLPAFLAGLDDEWRGLSLTMPLKREAMPLLASRDAWADLAGAANTLLLDGDGVHGLNTDVPGAIAALREATPASVDRAVVLGGGATATSVLLALAELGCGSAVLAVRDPARAAETLDGGSAGTRTHPAWRPCCSPSWTAGAPTWSSPRSRPRPSPPRCWRRWPMRRSCSTSSTTRGRRPWPPRPAPTGGSLVGGLDLLLWQAVDQVRAMTGRFDVPVAAMRDAGEAGLAERHR